MVKLYYSWLAACIPIFTLRFTTALDEAALKKQLAQCVLSIIGQMQAAAGKIANCNAIRTFCTTTQFQSSAVLELQCARSVDCTTKQCTVGSLPASELNCGGEHSHEILHEFIDRWCFSASGAKAWYETTEEALTYRAAHPKLAVTMPLDKFWTAVGKVEAAANPLPAKDILLKFLLDLVKVELKDKCESLSLVCGKGLSDIEIQGLGCSVTVTKTVYENSLAMGEDIKVKEKTTLYMTPPAVAFWFKMANPDARMEKATKAISDLFCSTDEITKNQPYKTMLFFKKALEKVAAKYTIA